MLFDVLQQSATLGKVFTTELAFKRSLSGVDAHVLDQRSGLRERLVASGALKRSFARVDAHMTDEVCLVREQFATFATEMCLHLVQDAQLAGMRLHVGDQVATLREALLADAARKGSFASVRPPMDGEHGAVREAFVAHFALKWLVPGVKTHVQRQVLGFGELFTAFEAHKCIRARLVRFLVLGEAFGGAENETTLTTLETGIARMEDLVFQQFGGFLERHVAEFAAKWSSGGVEAHVSDKVCLAGEYPFADITLESTLIAVSLAVDDERGGTLEVLTTIIASYSSFCDFGHRIGF